MRERLPIVRVEDGNDMPSRTAFVDILGL